MPAQDKRRPREGKRTAMRLRGLHISWPGEDVWSNPARGEEESGGHHGGQEEPEEPEADASETAEGVTEPAEAVEATTRRKKEQPFFYLYICKKF
jgi:hypothetical protein